MKVYVILLFSVLALIGCGGGGGEEDPKPIEPPTNLTVNVEVSETGTGEVTVVATATGAKYYTFDFNEFSDAKDVRNDGGTATYTYANAGTYTIIVRAHASSSVSIKTEEEITVTIDETVDIPADGFVADESYPNMERVWEDNFDEINMNDWTFEIGNGSSGWGNNELEYYTNGANAFIQDGNLVIKAKRQDMNGYKYTSTRMITKGKQSFQYGRIDIRAVLPEGQGIWPALWMLGDNISQVGWPRCGEIDIMEMVGGQGREKTVHGTPHWYNDVAPVGNANYGGSVSLSTGTFKDKFHVFSIVWDEEKIVWYMDNQQFHIIDTAPAVDASRLDEFRAPFFFIFNVAVGGNWPGSPNTSTQFPQHMVVDYVRVYQPI